MNSSRKLYAKINTFSKSPGAAQMLSYAVFLLETVLFYAVILQKLDNTPKIILGIIYSVSLISLIAVTIVCSSNDPSDTVMVKYRNGSRQQFQQYRKCYQEKMLYCDYCQSFVKQKSRHCKSCDRCTQNFDHHCMWINNCVGGLNYRSFFVMIISAFLNLLIYVIALIIASLEGKAIQQLGSYISACISGVINAIFVILLINLIILHLYLMNKGLTTYEFIIAQRQAEKKQKENENKQISLDSNKIQMKNVQIGINDGNSDKKEREDEQIKTKTIVYDSESINIIKISSHQQNEQINEIDKYKEGQVIFGQNQLTQKSVSNNDNKLQQLNEDIHVQPSNDSDDQSNSIQISQLFTRNKSLKFIIGKSQHYKPHKISRNDGKNKGMKSKSMLQPMRMKKENDFK